MESSAVQPDLVVLQRLPHLVPLEMLRLACIAVSRKSGRDQVSFLFGDEFGLSGPVSNVPERSDSEDNCQETLDDEDP